MTSYQQDDLDFARKALEADYTTARNFRSDGDVEVTASYLRIVLDALSDALSRADRAEGATAWYRDILDLVRREREALVKAEIEAAQVDRDKLLRLNVDLVNERDALKAEVEELRGSLEEWKLDHAALKAEVERLRAALAKWPSVMCPCYGDEAAFALYFEDGQPTTCGCGGTVMADESVHIRIGDCENPKCAALRGEEAPRE